MASWRARCRDTRAQGHKSFLLLFFKKEVLSDLKSWERLHEVHHLLDGFDALTGAVVFNGSGTAMTGVRNFAAILAAGNKFYVAGQGRIYAFTY